MPALLPLASRAAYDCLTAFDWLALHDRLMSYGWRMVYDLLTAHGWPMVDGCRTVYGCLREEKDPTFQTPVGRRALAAAGWHPSGSCFARPAAFAAAESEGSRFGEVSALPIADDDGREAVVVAASGRLSHCRERAAATASGWEDAAAEESAANRTQGSAQRANHCRDRN